MYRISKNERKHSPTPVVRIAVDENGKETEEFVCFCHGKKIEGDKMASLIVKLLNENEKYNIQ